MKLIGHKGKQRVTNEFLGKKEPNQPNDGSHAVICVGFQNLGENHYVYRMLNSWGKKYHDNGFFELEYNKDSKFHYYQLAPIYEVIPHKKS